jgi:hypothetical protein
MWSTPPRPGKQCNLGDAERAWLASLTRHLFASRVQIVHEWELRIVMYFDRETVSLLRTTLDRTWASLPPDQQARISRSVLAERILKAAAKGERDPDRLRARALMNDCAEMKVAS